MQSTNLLMLVGGGSPGGTYLPDCPVDRGRDPSTHRVEGMFRHWHHISCGSILLPFANGYLKVVRPPGIHHCRDYS